MTLTEKDIEQLKSPSGGFRADSISMLGENVMLKGWRTRLVGMQVTPEQFDQAKKIANLPRIKFIQFGEVRGQMALI